MVMTPWVAYLLAEGLELSGIVAILVNGSFLATYAVPNLDKTGKHILSAIYETIAYGCETIVFIFLGIGLVAAWAHLGDTGVLFLVGGSMIILFARVVVVLVVGGLQNLIAYSMG